VTAAVVEALAMCGHNYETIANRLDICKTTLLKYYKDQIEQAKVRANAKVAQTAYKMAVSGENASMTRYWLNCRSDDWNDQRNVDVTSDGEKVDGGGALSVTIHDSVVTVDDDEGDDADS